MSHHDTPETPDLLSADASLRRDDPRRDEAFLHCIRCGLPSNYPRAVFDAAGRLVRVSHPVAPELEMTEIQTRLLAEGGPAVLFENVIHTDGRRAAMPMLVNLFGTVERVAWSRGVDRPVGACRCGGRLLPVAYYTYRHVDARRLGSVLEKPMAAPRIKDSVGVNPTARPTALPATSMTAALIPAIKVVRRRLCARP